MSDVTTTGGVAPGLQAGSNPSAGPALLTFPVTGGAPVCEGDSCFVPGAEGNWTEVPD